MAKNDFDIDFDFEKEYGFDPKAILDSDYSDDDLDLSQFDDDILDRKPEQEFDDFDLDDLDLDEDETAPEATVYQKKAEEADDLDDLDFDDEEDYPDNADLTADMDFSRRTSFFGVSEQEVPAYEEPVYEEPVYEAPDYEEASYEVPEENIPEEPAEFEEPAEEPTPRPRRERPRKERKPVKVSMPPFVGKLKNLYFPSQQEILARMEPGEGRDGRRRRKPSKAQIFKEYYLPTVILGLAAVLVLSFSIGAVSNAIDRAKEEKLAAEQQAQQESLAAEQLASEAQNLMARAEVLAMSYRYQEAVDLLDSYQGEMTQEMTLKKSEYLSAKSALVEHQDPTLIPNLSFHVLIADMNRAIADEENGGSYNRNFVSTAEFSRILEQLYLNNYVLVDYDSFISSNSVDGTSSSLFADSIWLPAGKKPVMLTETMVNYFEYMIDGNDDGKPDAQGAGFASRLVVDGNGDVKAEYVDENGVTQVGNYDLVPILEDFIAKHPDFSYRGARATLAVCGYQGIFGYRIQSETIANKGQDYYNEQVVGATKVVERLRELGYHLACYTFENKDYSNISADQVNQDIQKWKSQIAPVIGEVDTIVFARAKDIGDYTGGKFDVLRAAGFRIMVKNADSPYTEINTDYVRQSRLMVTGENMVAKATMFTDNGLFDPNTVLDLSIRGNVPVG